VAGGVETELQFRYRGRAVPVVPTELAELVLAGSQRFLVVDTYFDTPTLQLREAGCSVRLRRADNSSQPRLTWKGKARKRGRAKQRGENEIPLDGLPASGEALADLLRRLDLWDVIRKAAKLGRDAELSEIGQVRNDRSAHTYVRGLKRLELTWDRLQYPKGPDEIRLEVEVKSRPAGPDLQRIRSLLEALFDGKLVPPQRGKASELCRRLYPDLV
jgi:uncharacterized protein YjbK